MADNDYSLVRPVQELQNILGLTPIRKQNEGRQSQEQKKKDEPEQRPQDEIEEAQKEPSSLEIPDPDIEGQTIDYRA